MLVAVAAILVGCTMTIGGTATPDSATAEVPPPPTTATPSLVPTASMRDLLLKRSELGEIVGDTDMKEVESFNGPNTDIRGFEPLQCAYRAKVAATLGYASDARQGLLGDTNRGARGNLAAQVVSVFDSRKAPTDVLFIARLDWFSCAEGQMFTVRSSDNDISHWVAGATTVTPTRIATTIRREEPPPRSCHHVLAAQANVVVEAFACGDGDTTAQVNAIADKILAEIPQ
jgi:hypothetical protein